MTNWKADPKVTEAIETLQAAIARCTADFVDGRIVQKIGELCAAVAASGSPPSPRAPTKERLELIVAEVMEKADAMDDLGAWNSSDERKMIEGLVCIAVETTVERLRASSGSTGAPEQT